MKLNRENKFDVSIGDIIRFSENEAYYVTAVIIVRNRVSYGLKNVKTRQNLYSWPSSDCYGAEIIKAGGWEQ